MHSFNNGTKWRVINNSNSVISKYLNVEKRSFFLFSWVDLSREMNSVLPTLYCLFLIVLEIARKLSSVTKITTLISLPNFKLVIWKDPKLATLIESHTSCPSIWSLNPHSLFWWCKNPISILNGKLSCDSLKEFVSLRHFYP